MNSKNDIIALITVRNEPNEDCLPEEYELERMDAWAKITSIKRNEFYSADRNGIKLSMCITINVEDWEVAGKDGLKPSIALVDGKRYPIYRTYQTNDSELELILQEVE